MKVCSSMSFMVSLKSSTLLLKLGMEFSYHYLMVGTNIMLTQRLDLNLIATAPYTCIILFLNHSHILMGPDLVFFKKMEPVSLIVIKYASIFELTKQNCFQSHLFIWCCELIRFDASSSMPFQTSQHLILLPSVQYFSGPVFFPFPGTHARTHKNWDP